MKNSTAFILILTAAGLFYTVMAPQYSKSQDLRAQAAEYKNILQNVSSLTDKKNDLLVKYQAMPKAEIERIDKVLPDTVDTVRLAMDFDTIASKYGISIKSIQVVENRNDNTTKIIQNVADKPYNTVNVTFSFITNYDNFRKFMQDIEKSLRIIDTKTVAFDSGESGLNEYKVSIQTYWLK